MADLKPIDPLARAIDGGRGIGRALKTGTAREGTGGQAGDSGQEKQKAQPGIP